MNLSLRALARRTAVPGVVAGALLLTSLTPALAGAGAAAAVPTRADQGSAPTSAGDDRLTLATPRAKAERTLARAERLLAEKPVTAAREQLTSGRDTTMVLRRLRLQRDALTPADRAAARALGDRPTDVDVVTCSLTCVHYDSAETDPVFAATVAATMDYVQGTYSAAGYRTPLPDKGLGGNDLPDIYLDDIGKQGLFGFCTSDQKKFSAPGRHDAWAFCVMDNDFSTAEFPENSPVENMQVTAAHEYFHATQFAYDLAEDDWLLESLSTWVEDQLYPDVNDNLRYLRQSVINKPLLSLDKGSGFGVYGSWIWIRYLTEQYPQLQGPMPKVVLGIFKRMDSSKGARKDLYSMQAIAATLSARGGLDRNLVQFADANRRPSSSYAEGALYPTANLQRKYSLAGGTRVADTARLDHLSSATVRFVAKDSLKKRSATLALSVDLGDKRAGSAAAVSVYLRTGEVKTTVVKLNGRGNGSKTVPFSATRVSYVELTMANTSVRYANCYERVTPFSCSGQPVDQGVREVFRASARR